MGEDEIQGWGVDKPNRFGREKSPTKPGYFKFDNYIIYCGD